ncbi:hypothetical protein GCM10009850_031450 [Nonomuraea monospora]|uniref:Integral membrane protein n=1 Tax=Nonomuraea monospora TaxID=568818 RepID=A0ABN3CE76_9ACTN
MGCLFVLLAAAFPRLMLLFVWVARPALVDAAFGTWIIPLLGVVLLPFATLTYVLLYYPTNGLSGGAWAWVVFAAFLDVLHWVAGAARRQRAVYVGRPYY